MQIRQLEEKDVEWAAELCRVNARVNLSEEQRGNEGFVQKS